LRAGKLPLAAIFLDQSPADIANTGPGCDLTLEFGQRTLDLRNFNVNQTDD
jgi:hypothetical protein